MRRPVGWERTGMLLAASGFLIASGCGEDTQPGGACLLNSECPDGQMCSLGRCTPASGPIPAPQRDAGPRPAVRSDGGPGCDSPPTCDELSAECGLADDGCGSRLDCGDCPAPATCGGGGQQNRCGVPNESCVPSTCEQLGANCGDLGDGCGGGLRCGSCPSYYKCHANRCGCDADTCESLNAECGADIPDGCGGTLDCGTCTAPETCGGAGTPNQCGCTKRIVATEWKNGVTFFSTSSWRNADFARAHDNQYATFSFHHMCHGDNGGGGQIGPYTRTSNHLDLRGYDIQVPAGAKLTGIEARVKQSGGKLVEAVIFTARGPTANLGNGRVAGGFHYFGGPNNLFGKELTAEHTHTRGHWGLSMRAEATAPRSPCPRTEGISRVDVIQFRAHYEICD